MKKAIYILVPISIILFMISIVIYKNFIPNDIMSDNKSKKIMTTNTISMMYETSANSGIYEAIKDNKWPTSGYIFNETLSKCENGSELSWDDNTQKVIMTGSMSDKCYVYFDKELITIANYIKGLYITQGANNLYHHDGTLENGIDDGSYRYSGAYENVNNWVCFGSNAEECPEDNLYRIIGVFNENNVDTREIESRVKLILNNYAGQSVLGKAQDGTSTPNSSFTGVSKPLYNVASYKWDSNNKDIWTTSSLNIDILNNTYLTKLGIEWTSKISSTEWKIGGNTWVLVGDVTPAISYKNEIINNVADTSGNKVDPYFRKIGLLYVSDYGFASSRDNWNKKIATGYTSVDNNNYNWLYRGVDEWTITRYTTYAGNVFGISSEGGAPGYSPNNSLGIRPAFYLNSNVSYASGTGTQSDPFRIS